MATPCEERAGKYALKVGKVVGLSGDEAWALREAYMKSCANWENGFKSGVRAYAIGKAITTKEQFISMYGR
jgi:hypothetical protein